MNFQKRLMILGWLCPETSQSWSLLRTVPKLSAFWCFLKLNSQNHFWKIRISRRLLCSPLNLQGYVRKDDGKQMQTGSWAASGTQPQYYTCQFLGEGPELGFAHLLPVEAVAQPLFLAWFTPYVWMTVALPGTVPEHWAYVNYLLVTPGAFNCSYILHNWQQQHLKLPGTGAAPRGFEG